MESTNLFLMMSSWKYLWLNRNACDPLNSRKVNFILQENYGKYKHSKVMDFLNISVETEIYTNLKNIRPREFHITEKLWEY